MEEIGDQRYLCLTYYRRTNAPDLTYRVEASEELREWRDHENPVLETFTTPVSAGFERVTVRWPNATATSPTFLRVRVTRRP